MITLYWGMEYGKVFLGYLFLMFLWPSVVFYKHLQNKSKVYRFGFCVAIQPVIVNTVVLCLGLLHILNRWVVILLFYGTFIAVVCKRFHINHKKIEQLYRVATGVYGVKTFLLGNLKEWAGKQFFHLWSIVKNHFWEYVLLCCLLVYGMIYFSYGVFQDPTYGASDMYPHHEWVYGLVEGQAFSGKVYPEGMHCFIYAIYALFGIRVYSVLLFLAGIHIITFLLSAYCLMREIFRWRFTPFLVLTMFLIMDLVSVVEIVSMARLQWTLPQEFGLYTQFICALFLTRYLKAVPQTVRKGKILRSCWDENLFVFMMALTASIAIHFYTTIIAFFLCLAFAVTGLRRILTKGHFLPLVAAVITGFFIAVVPMALALASGIPFHGSIGWAMNVMKGGQESEATEPDEGELMEQVQTEQEQRLLEDNETSMEEVWEREDREALEEDIVTSDLPDNRTSWEKLQDMGQKAAAIFRQRFPRVFWGGYNALYGTERAQWIVRLTGLAFALWLLYWFFALVLSIPFKGKINVSCFNGYPAVILASVLYMVVYTSGYLGLPQLIDGLRICSSEQMLILMVLAIPVDMMFSLLALLCKDWILQGLSLVCVGGVCVLVYMLDYYHGYLYHNLTRYSATAMVTNSIIETLPRHQYTIVSPTEELYQIIEYGRHEELWTFVQESQGTNYILPTEYVFFYIEKKPIECPQNHFFQGPSWLASDKYQECFRGVRFSQCPEVISAEISEEMAQEETRSFAQMYQAYINHRNRIILESKAYDWCQRFSQLYPFELNVYYEDEDFICYYFRQEPNAPYDLGIG